MTDKSILRDTKYVTQALANCRASCDEMAAKYRREFEANVDDRNHDWLQKTLSFIDRQTDYVQQGVEEIQIYKMTRQLLHESDMRVQKYTNEMRMAHERIDLLLNELNHTEKMLRKSETLVIQQEAKIAELTLLCDLKSLDDLHKAQPLTRLDMIDVIGNLSASMLSRGPGLGNDKTTTSFFGDAAPRLNEENEAKEGAEGSVKAAENFPLPSSELLELPAKRVLTEAESMRKRRNTAVTLFNDGNLDQAKEILKELLSESHQRIVTAAATAAELADDAKPLAECVWEMAERHEAEHKDLADQTDEERAALLASIDGNSEDIQSALKVLGEIYRRKGQYCACELLEDVALRVRNQNPSKSKRAKSKRKKT